MPDVLAIICAYNEADILPWTIAHLKQQGCRVHVIDNWSTDESWRTLATADTWERYPEHGPSRTFDWAAMLRRVEQVAWASGARWCIHHDADEIRRSPREGETIAAGLARVEAEGYNAIDHRVITFHPTDNGYHGNPEAYFHRCTEDAMNTRIGQVKAWRNLGRVDLASSGGHQAMFPGRRVHPEPWLLKHYPIRSQQQGERKVFRERQPRWNPQERARDWHVQYDRIRPGHNFLGAK